MAGQKTRFDAFLADEAEKYHGVLVPVKANLLERIFIRKVPCNKLHPNPNDEFCNPAIGPNYEIISGYEHKLKEARMHTDPPWEDPILVEKMIPDGYLILNGHHRWAACVRFGEKKIGVRVVNLTQETDIRKMISESDHDRRATFDLDEVVFCSEDVPVQDPPAFPLNKIYKERIREGIPAVFHFLTAHHYDIWVYTAQYYSIEYIRKLFRSYHVHVDGIVTGTGRPQDKENDTKKKLEQLIKGKYKQTIHIDDKTLIRSWSDKKDFDQFEISAEGASWSQQTLQILKNITKEGTVLS